MMIPVMAYYTKGVNVKNDQLTEMHNLSLHQNHQKCENAQNENHEIDKN